MGFLDSAEPYRITEPRALVWLSQDYLRHHGTPDWSAQDWFRLHAIDGSLAVVHQDPDVW